MDNLKILAIVQPDQFDPNMWTFYECGKFTCTVWGERYAFWTIEVDKDGVKRMYWRNRDSERWVTDYEDISESEDPCSSDLIMIEQIELAIAVNEMIEGE